MPRVKRGTQTHRRHASLLALAKGYRTGRNNLYKRASEAVMQAGQFAYRDRRTKKRDLRRGWIVRVNAAVREHGMTYSTFMHALKTQNVTIDRKVLASLATEGPESLAALVQLAKNSK